eukprot:scaffold321597_cov32-Tisochrysis_lutea.AAC.3
MPSNVLPEDVWPSNGALRGNTNEYVVSTHWGASGVVRRGSSFPPSFSPYALRLCVVKINHL